MDNLQEIMNDNDTLAGKCRQMGDLLGIAEPVAENVLLAALYDESYAHNLLVSRRDPEMLNLLLANPPTVSVPHPPSEKNKSSVELIGRMSEAVWKWAKTGFSTVDEQQMHKRLQACMACPNLSGKPDSLLYKALSGSQEDSVCRLCGCIISKKTRLTSENCPDPHPLLQGVSRWEEAF